MMKATQDYKSPTAIKEEFLDKENEGVGTRITRDEMKELENPGYQDHITGKVIRYHKNNDFISYQKSKGEDEATDDQSINNSVINLENEVFANINIAEEPFIVFININLRDLNKRKGKAIDLDPDFMKCKANRLLSF
ncbi:MAG: hypothetical protein ALECFALPRED_005648 [Alectoria fallacina]|uniref:Uncharacterized protein n=1 Tax=Alectoria fallacina TaxID=1903189 RepID=A0A8H3IV43_9LECA|nr:MAG: hypothetical protein ALECFALPRED_005648 [Alectoria fallacina]